MPHSTWFSRGRTSSLVLMILVGLFVFGLSASPAGATNLVTNGGFETDTSGWFRYNVATLTRSTAKAKFGSASLSVVTSGTIPAEGATLQAFTGAVPVAPNISYTYSVWAFAPSGASMNIAVDWYTSAPAYISTMQVDFTGTGAWQQVSITGTSPATASELLAEVRTITVTQAITFYVDGVSVVATYLFDDEFGGTSGSAPDPAKWWKTPWCSSAGDDIEGCYNAANVYQDGAGHLALKASTGTMGRPYDMARVQTFQEGGWPPPSVLFSAAPPIRIEVRAKFAPGPDLWEGIWSMGTNTSTPNELDTQEFRGYLPTLDTCTYHPPGGGGGSTGLDTGIDLSADYHTYWVNYYTDHTVFGIDASTCAMVTGTVAQPQGIRLSNAVAPPGSWGAGYYNGLPPAQYIPALMLVDYVRVSAL